MLNTQSVVFPLFEIACSNNMRERGEKRLMNATEGSSTHAEEDACAFRCTHSPWGPAECDLGARHLRCDPRTTSVLWSGPCEKHTSSINYWTRPSSAITMHFHQQSKHPPTYSRDTTHKECLGVAWGNACQIFVLKMYGDGVHDQTMSRAEQPSAVFCCTAKETEHKGWFIKRLCVAVQWCDHNTSDSHCVLY